MNKNTINKSATKSKLSGRKPRRVFVVDDVSCLDMKSNQMAISNFGEHIFSKTYYNDKKCFKEESRHNYSRDHNSEEFQFQKNAWNSNLEVDVANYGSNRAQKTPTFKALAAMFFKKSSIYALNQIANSKTTRRKLFWSIIMIGGLLGCSSQIYRFLTAYYKYPVVVNIDSVSEFSLTFPAVTICNFNGIRKGFVPCFIEQLSYEQCNETNFFNKSEVEFISNIKQPSCVEEANETLSPALLEKIQFLTIYSKLNAATRKYYGHQAETFIRSCSFKGEACSHSDFTSYQDSLFGNCYTFNKGNESKPPLKTSYVGPGGGLDLELDLEISEYFWITKKVGARVVIHDPFNKPDPQEDGLNVSPGFETSIGLSKISYRRLPYPYKDQCIYYKAGDDKRKCGLDCSRKIAYSTCSCDIPFYDNAGGARYCDLNNDTEICCLFRNLNEAEYKCHCPLACENSHYEVKISNAVWPSRAYRKARPANDLQESISMENFRETRLKVNIYYDTLDHLIYQQRPMFEDSEVLSQIGGQMGLWLGLSLVALFECLENFFLMWEFRNKQALSL